MSPLVRTCLALMALALAGVACSGSEPASAPPTALPSGEPFALVASSPSEVAVGERRVLLGLRNADGSPLESIDRPVVAEFFRPGEYDTPAFSTQLGFVWMVEGSRGVYEATIEFDEPGLWGVRLVAPEIPATAATPFQVMDDTIVPDVGDRAPASQTLTAPPNEIADITTDPNPDPEFYRMTVAQALASGRPTVLVFATPAFCQTAVCGPLLDLVKAEAPGYPEVNFVHVEVYDLTNTEELTPVPAIDEWRLPSEPWVFVIDAEGVITARFEGVMDAAGMAAALDSVS